MKTIRVILGMLILSFQMQAQILLHHNAVSVHKTFDASSEASQDAITGATDTLEYFFNKHYFRNPTAANANLNFLSLI